MHQNHKNPDGSYTYFATDGNGNEIPVVIELGDLADEMDEMDRSESNQENYDRQNRDVLFEQKKRRSINPNEDYDGNPIDSIPDSKVSVHELVFGDAETERTEIIMVRTIIEALPEKKRDLIFQRYGMNTSKAEIGRREGVTREAIRRREVRLLEELKKKLAEAGIDDAYFDRRRP